MNRQSASIQQRESIPPDRVENTNLHGGWLVLARVVWIIVVMLSVGLFIISIPFDFASSHIICATASCSDTNQLTLDQVHELQHLGLSIDFYAIFNVALTIIFAFGYVATGVMIFWHKSNERVALVTSFALVTFVAAFQGSNLLTLYPGLHVLSLGMAFVGNVCFGFFFCLFPTGRFTPRWTRWLVLGWIVYWGFNNLLLGLIVTDSGFDSALFLALLLSVVAIQAYHYRRVSTPVQRQQTKWVVFGLSVAIIGFLLTLSVVFTLVSNLHLGIIAYLIAESLLYLFLLLLP